MRTSARIFICLAALSAALLAMVRVQLRPLSPDMRESGNGTRVEKAMKEQTELSPLDAQPVRMDAKGATSEVAQSGGSDLKANPDTQASELGPCSSCQALKDEVARLRRALTQAERRAGELTLAAIQDAFEAGTPIGDAVRQEEFMLLPDRYQHAFIELMESHFPIDLSQAEVAWIAQGLEGKGDVQFQNNPVRACVYFLGPQRILDGVARSRHASQIMRFDKEYIESLARGE